MMASLSLPRSRAVRRGILRVLRLRDRTAQPFLRTPANESAPRFPPDGHWLAYVSDETGRWEVYVQP